MKSEILYTSGKISNTIFDIFSASKGRKVVIVAFVGSQAEKYLPNNIKGMELICWPKAGGTNPDGIRMLMKKEVKVSFADVLHMKLYWTEDKGAVLTSANLSTNALGSGNLQEIGILVPSEQIDIDKIIRQIKPRPASEKELAQLDIAHREYQKANNKMKRESAKPHTFLDWYELPNRNNGWKLGYWDVDSLASLAAKRASKELYGVSEPQDFLSCGAKRYKVHDLVLKFCLETDTPTQMLWLNVDYVVKTDTDDLVAYDPKYPYHAVQARTKKFFSDVDVPFALDKDFQKAFRAAIKEYGADRFRKEDPSIPSSKLIELIKKNYKSNV